MTGDFLKQALTTILAERQHPQLQIVDLCLETLHAAVECSDGSAGLALNYDQEGNEQLDPQLLRTLGQRLLERATSQPLLAETLFLPDEAPTLRALSIALLNALSAPLCQPEEAMRRGFVALPGRLPLQSFYGLATRLTVVGCGGYLEEALHLPWLQRVACLDLHFDTSEGRARYQPYLENVVEPHRQHKEIVLEGPSSSPTILAETDLLCLSGSTLCNDTFWSLAESSRHCCALLLEGHSAGLWPGLLQSWGVQHVVRTPIDLPVAALLRRYAGQLQRGHAQLGPGPYVDCLFPERTTLVAISGPARARGQRWLLLQARDPDDAMIGHEQQCFERALGRPVEVRSLLQGGLASHELSDCAAVLVGGSGRYGAAHNREFWFLPALESLRLVLRQNLPLFASCWGIQSLACALGGRVEARPEFAEYGSVRLLLTPAGQRDPLLQGLGEDAWVQAGHSETVTQLPAGVELLAASTHCPTQMFRLSGRPVYACQFHAELRAEDLNHRMEYYRLPPSSEGPRSSADQLGPRLLARFMASLGEAG